MFFPEITESVPSGNFMNCTSRTRVERGWFYVGNKLSGYRVTPARCLRSKRMASTNLVVEPTQCESITKKSDGVDSSSMYPTSQRGDQVLEGQLPADKMKQGATPLSCIKLRCQDLANSSRSTLLHVTSVTFPMLRVSHPPRRRRNKFWDCDWIMLYTIITTWSRSGRRGPEPDW